MSNVKVTINTTLDVDLADIRQTEFGIQEYDNWRRMKGRKPSWPDFVMQQLRDEIEGIVGDYLGTLQMEESRGERVKRKFDGMTLYRTPSGDWETKDSHWFLYRSWVGADEHPADGDRGRWYALCDGETLHGKYPTIAAAIPALRTLISEES